MPKQVPVYLFTGFLESGKTKFAQETLQDSSFNNGDRMLLLVCEEGIEEYNPDEFASPNIFMEVIETERDLTTEHLAALLKKHRASYVIVEYNGMWMLDSLYTSMPPEWVVAQEFMFIDATTFLNYNNNMRQLMVDKLQSCELVVLNRFPEGDEDLKLQAHKIVRATNRRCDIAFENYGGVRYDKFPAGPITVKDILNLDPFMNTAVVMTLTGKELSDMLIACFNADRNRFPITSGCTAVVTYTDATKKTIKKLELFAPDGKKLDMKKKYRVMTNNYVASICDSPRQDEGERGTDTTSSIIISWLEKMGTVDYQGRSSFTEKW